jgi:transposase-like protein
MKGVQDAEASNERTASASLLDEIVRDGARPMLATALQAEVIASVEAFAAACGAEWPNAVATIADGLDVLFAVYDVPGEHRIHRRTTDPSESAFSTVRLRQRVTTGPGSRAAGIAMAFKRIESVQARWRAVNAPRLVALVRAGAIFENGKLVDRADESGGDAHAA